MKTCDLKVQRSLLFEYRFDYAFMPISLTSSEKERSKPISLFKNLKGKTETNSEKFDLSQLYPWTTDKEYEEIEIAENGFTNLCFQFYR